MLVQRENECNKITHRDLFETPPPNVDVDAWHTFREQYNRAAQLQSNDNPAQVDVELNSHCNLKCDFCIHSVRHIRKQLLGADTFYDIVRQMIAFGTRSLKLNYMNEPLLLPDLEDYIRHAKRAGIVNVFFSTNGILLNADRIDTLIDSGLTKLFVSIDAVTRDTYFRQRNADRYFRVVKNTLQFIKRRNQRGLKYPLVRVNFLKNNVNTHEEQEFVRLWENRADMVIIQEMYEVIDRQSTMFMNATKENYKCSFPFKQLVITHSGDILPCCTMHGLNLKLGNIRTMTLREAWNSTAMHDLRQLHFDGNYASNPICKYCINGH